MGKRRGKGEGGIYQRESDGRWCANIDLGFVGGKRRRKVIYGETRKEVTDKLKALHNEQAAGKTIVTERQTVGQYLDRWLESSIRPHRRPKTAASYEQIVRLYLKPHLGKFQLAKLTPEHVQVMVNTLLVSGAEDSTPLSARTVQYVRAVLRQTLNQAQRWGLVSRNVAMLVEVPRVEKHTATVLSPEEGQRLLATVAGHRLEALYHVALLLGLREGEVLGLRWIDLDFTAHTLRVEQTVQRVSGKIILAAPKTASSKRTLPMPNKVERALARHAERQAEERMRDDWEDYGLVFPSERGTPMEPRNLVRHFKSVLERADLPDIRFHDLRHSCATMLIAQGTHPRTVMEILGHSQISVTMNTYGHVMPETQRAAAEALERLFPTEQDEQEGTESGDARASPSRPGKPGKQIRERTRQRRNTAMSGQHKEDRKAVRMHRAQCRDFVGISMPQTRETGYMSGYMYPHETAEQPGRPGNSGMHLRLWGNLREPQAVAGVADARYQTQISWISGHIRSQHAVMSGCHVVIGNNRHVEGEICAYEVGARSAATAENMFVPVHPDFDVSVAVGYTIGYIIGYIFKKEAIDENRRSLPGASNNGAGGRG